jgi:mannose-1-phosphate guanylyltransferase
MPDSSPAAILLVGGRGTRLAPLTDLTPKPMLPVGGVPFTLHQILQARSAGIKRIVLATSYLAEVFEPYFGDGSRFDLEIRYAVEKEALGTGGGIRNAAELLDRSDDAPIVIFNGDVLSAHDLAGQIRRHRERDADVTLYLTKVEDARAYGVVPTDGEGWVETFPSLLSAGRRVQGFIDEGYWRDIGTPSALIAASADLITGRFRSPATPTPNSPSGAGYIAPTAQISENVVVAEGSVILDGAMIGEGSQILGSIIGEKAVIDAGSVIRTTFVAPHSRIARIDVEGEILGF